MRLRHTQEVSGGRGIFSRIYEYASDKIDTMIRSGDITQEKASSLLSRAMSSKWTVRFELSPTGKINIVAQAEGGYDNE